MHSAEQVRVASRPASFERSYGTTRSVIRQAGTVVLQVDAAVSSVHGLAWLAAHRDATTLVRLSEVQAEAREQSWTAAQLVCARLSILRPRRAEINALGRAYLSELAPGVVDAAHRIRRAGIAVGLASDVAAEALFGVATALGVTPEDIQAPTVRFDALGSYTGSEVARRSSVATMGDRPVRVFVGARPSDLGPPGDPFIRFTGFVSQEGTGVPALETLSSFADLATLVAG